MAATAKEELLVIEAKEFAKLDKLMDEISSENAFALDDDGVCTKDIVGHRAHWCGLFLEWYHDGLAGKEVFFPAEDYRWNDLKRYNADLRRAQSDLGWDEARALLRSERERLVVFIEQHSDIELYAAPMAGANNNWTPGRWAEAAGPSHYRSASKYVSARLREAQAE